MQSIIQKAIEGGYKGSYIAKNHKNLGAVLPQWEAVLNPLFWQALGKACGWEEKWHQDGCYSHFEGGACDCHTEIKWQHYSLYFHELNLTEGWDTAVKWLEDLINQSK